MLKPVMALVSCAVTTSRPPSRLMLPPSTALTSSARAISPIVARLPRNENDEMRPATAIASMRVSESMSCSDSPSDT